MRRVWFALLRTIGVFLAIAVLLVLVAPGPAFAERGHITTESKECPTRDRAEVFNVQGKLTGVVPNKAVVSVNVDRQQMPGFVWIQGPNFAGENVSGYVHAYCVTLDLTKEQSEVGHEPDEAPPFPDQVNCAQFLEPSPGCNSFNKMLAANDLGILRLLWTRASDTFVCFRQDEDVFTLIAIGKPTYDRFRRVPNTGSVKQYGTVSVIRYKNGLAEQSHLFGGQWIKAADSAIDEAGFSGHDSKSPSTSNLSIDANQIALSVKSKNPEGTLATYSLQVRRSTRTMLETFDAPASAAAHPGAASHSTNTGHCAEYNVP